MLAKFSAKPTQVSGTVKPSSQTPKPHELGLSQRFLLNVLKKGNVPQHVGLIMDGNRRYSRAHKLQSIQDGYKLGAEVLQRVTFKSVEVCF